MSTTRPSLVLNFTLRFDEALHVMPDPPLAGAISQAANVVSALQDPTAAANQALGRSAQNQGQPLGDLLILKRGSQNESHVFGIVPKSGHVELPGYRQAGQFNFTMDYRAMPIDPRVVRAASVEVHLGVVSATDFGQGITRDGRSVLEVKQPRGGDPGTLVMRGLVDEWDVEHGPNGSEVTITGRDLRGLLLDTPIGATDPKAGQYVLEQLDLSKPLNEVIVQLLGFNPMFTGFQPFVDPREWPEGVIPSPGLAFSVPRHRRRAKGESRGGIASMPGGHAAGGGGAGRTSFWDLIVRLCYLCGAIPYFVGKRLLIRPARGIYAQLQADEKSPVQPPFAGGRPRAIDSASGDPIEGGPLRVRRLVYGRDVQTLRFNRKTAGYQRPHTVRAVAVDASSSERGKGKVVEARWPPEKEKKARVQRVAPGGQQAAEEMLNVPVPGVRDTKQLQLIAKALYEEIGRGEIGGNCETPNSWSHGGSDGDPDLLRLRPGDAVEFGVDVRSVRSSPPLTSTFTDDNRRSFESQVQEVKRALGGDENLARALVGSTRGQISELQSNFRVSSVRFDWGEDGLGCKFDFQNYVEVRAPVDAQTTGADLLTAKQKEAAGL